MIKEQQPSYRQIMKATSIFGGVQVFNIIIQIIRSKFVAVFLGPTGMGILGLLTATIGIIGGLTNFGLGTSAVKDIAAANSSANYERIATIVTVFKRLVIITGIFGTILVLVLSPWLSRLTFGNSNDTIAFCWISVTLLLSQLSSGQMVILQGMRKLQYLAKANLFGSLAGLLVSLPLYYKYGNDGIIPVMIGSAVISLLVSWFYSRQVPMKFFKVSGRQTIAEGKGMLKMGFMISLSSLLSLGVSYIVGLFISRIGGVDQVGLYNAGFSIINNYVGIIFAAMGTDYYPRLSAVAHHNNLCKQTINQQAEIAILILGPILVFFLSFVNWVIILLYSQKFIAVTEMIYCAVIGVFFKAVSWSVAFIFLAKGDGKLFFWNELIANIYLLTLNLLGYYYMGLTGLGISFAVAYLVYMCQVYFVSKIKYGFSFQINFIVIFVIQFSITILGFLIVTYLIQPYAYLVGTLLVGFSGFYSLVELDRRIDLKKLAFTRFGGK